MYSFHFSKSCTEAFKLFISMIVYLFETSVDLDMTFYFGAKRGIIVQ